MTCGSHITAELRIGTKRFFGAHPLLTRHLNIKTPYKKLPYCIKSEQVGSNAGPGWSATKRSVVGVHAHPSAHPSDLLYAAAT